VTDFWDNAVSSNIKGLYIREDFHTVLRKAVKSWKDTGIVYTAKAAAIHTCS